MIKKSEAVEIVGNDLKIWRRKSNLDILKKKFSYPGPIAASWTRSGHSLCSVLSLVTGCWIILAVGQHVLDGLLVILQLMLLHLVQS